MPGLEASEDVARLLWNWGVAVVASDNPALEAKPYSDTDHLQWILLARLGMPIGELWRIDALASACAAEHRYEFLLTSAPMNLPGGVGSPANVLAVM
jgi:hypothetical protein